MGVLRFKLLVGVPLLLLNYASDTTNVGMQEGAFILNYYAKVFTS